MATAPESTIADALVAVVSGVTGVTTVNFDQVRAQTSDFHDHELPACQFYDIGQTIEHNRGRILINWALSLEIVMKTVDFGGDFTEVNQKSLWNLRRDIQLAIWDKPNLGIPTVVHSILTGNITDLHFVLPFYTARIDFSVQFYDDLTGSC